MHNRRTSTGAIYTYDPASGAVFYGEADADAFAHKNGVTWLAACGCRAETGCQCHQQITTPAAPSKTPLSWVCASVDRIRREMRAEMAKSEAERESQDALRKLRAQIAADFRYAIEHPPPRPYDIALADSGVAPKVWRSTSDEPPEPYTEALRRKGEAN